MNFNDWIKYIDSADPLDRSEAADCIPVGGDQSLVVDKLLECLGDKDELVRIAAIDTLSQFSSKKVSEKLRERLGLENDELCRAYLYSSLAFSGNFSDMEILYNAFSIEQSDLVKTYINFGLVILTMRYSYRKIVSELNEDNPDKRSVAAGLITNLVDIIQQEKGELISALDTACKKESFRGIRIKLQSLLQDLG